MASARACLSENEVLALLSGGLDAATLDEARTHVDTCDDCQELLACVTESLVPVPASGPPDPLAATLAATEHAPEQRNAARTAIGRYRIVETIGRGASGIVYLAEDPSLRRRVALKMLRAQDADGAERLRREAQALARLSNPSVIVVYEVGTIEGEVFMAMEFVEGRPLSSWLERARPLDEVLDAFVQAGHGLAVAHDAALVHRDFKPDNVLVGDDGRVRVLDFGLAREGALLSEGSVRDLSRIERLPALAGLTSLTRTGAFVGTPAYMAPEQYEGKPADARSDQFAFCVALYEAIEGARPFAGETIPALAAEVLAGRVRPLRGTRHRVSKRIEAAVRRGLSRAPGERFASMRDLLAELRPEPKRRVPGTVAVLAVVAASALGYAAWGRMRTVTAPRAPLASLPTFASAGAASSASSASSTSSASSAPAFVATVSAEVPVDAGAAAVPSSGGRPSGGVHARPALPATKKEDAGGGRVAAPATPTVSATPSGRLMPTTP